MSFKKFLDVFSRSRKPSKKKTPHIYVTRYPRVLLSSQHIRFILYTKTRRIELSIFDLSFSGIAFNAESFPKAKEGMQGNGILHVGELRISLDFEIIHMDEDKVGCHFIKPPTELQRVLRAAFHFELKAHDLLKVKTENDSEEILSKKAYFASGGKNELYYLFRGESIEIFALAFDGIYIEGGRNRKLVMGTIVFPIKQKLDDPDASFPVEVFEELNPSMLYLSKIYVENVEGIEPIHRQGILNYLSQGEDQAKSKK